MNLRRLQINPRSLVVLAHDAFGAREEVAVDVVGIIELAQRMTARGEAFVRALAGGAVFAQVVGGGDPAGEGGVEFVQTVDGGAVEPQGQFEVALDGLDEAFDFRKAGREGCPQSSDFFRARRALGESKSRTARDRRP